MENKGLIELLTGVIFVIFLVLLVLIILNLNNGEIKKTNFESNTLQPNIVNNYYYKNTYNYPEKTTTGNVVYKYPNYNYVVYKEDPRYFEEDCYKNKKNNRFSSYGRHIKTKQLNGYLDEYRVFIRNEDSVGKQFKVVFYFEGEEKLEDSEVMIKYIDSGETEKFTYRDQHFERVNYKSWSYEIFGQDDGFEKEFYESNTRTPSFNTVPTISCR